MNGTDSPHDALQTAKGAALVTGAGNRIGASLARGLAELGHAVVIHYHASASDAQALAKDLTQSGHQAHLLQCNLADRAERKQLIAKANALAGPLHVLVNNASIYEPDSVQTLDEDLWDTHFALHTEAPLFLARDFAAQLPPNTEGNIVNLIDARVFDLTPAYTSYTLSKAALYAATRTMAQSLAPRIRVNAIGPGPTLPEAGQSLHEFEQRIAQLPLQVPATLDEMVGALRFILSSPSMTGQMIALDGGSHLAWPARAAPTPRAP